MLHIKQTVIVEGKYDKIRLSNIIDAKIITTGGFDIFGDAPKRAMLRSIAKKNGIIVLTDSDRAGFRIRTHLSGSLPKENVIHLYIPQREGKEARKEHASKDGYLGVEGIGDEELEALFLPFATSEERQRAELSKTDMYELGLSGGKNSSELRQRLALSLGLPKNMSANALLAALNIMFTKKEVEDAVRNLGN